jgi:hypothetical protein
VDGGGGVQVKHLGQHDGGDLAGEVHEGAAAPRPGVDAELGQALPEMAGVEGSTRVKAGEEPGPFGWRPDPRVGVAGGSQLDDEGAERLRHHRSAGPEAQAHLVVEGDHLVQGHGHDAAELLGVEQDQAAGHPVGEAQTVGVGVGFAVALRGVATLAEPNTAFVLAGAPLLFRLVAIGAVLDRRRNRGI